MLSRARCEQLDREDALRQCRAQFRLPDKRIYLNGNSLGPMPLAAQAALNAAISAWQQDAVGAWNSADWIGLSERVAVRLAPLLGVQSEELVVADSTSVNLYKLLHAVLRMAPAGRALLVEQDNFPTDSYVAQGLNQPLRAAPSEQIIDAIDGSTAAVLLSQVHYRSGRMQDMAAINARAAAVGATVVWDLAHSTGAVPLDLHAAGTQFAVGCGYKFLNGGPGAPAYAYVAREYHERLRNPIQGWFGHAEPFAFAEDYRPAPGIDRLQVGTPPILSMAALDGALSSFNTTVLPGLFDKAQRQFDVFYKALEQHLRPIQDAESVQIVTPPEAGAHGSQISVRMPMAGAVNRALQAVGVVGDFRAPDILRFGIAPLYTRYVDLWDAAESLADVLVQRRWAAPEFQQQPRVT